MFKFTLQNLHPARAAATMASSPTHNLYFLQIHPFSSSLKSMENSSNRGSFAVNYLINSCGFTPERALSASKYMQFEVPDKPDSVLAFFKNQGFTQPQISKLIKLLPPVLLCNPENTLLPKLQFLKSKGISSSDMAIIITRSPTILKRSIHNQLMPSFNFFSNLFQSDEKTAAAIKRSAEVLLVDLEKFVKPNIEMLKQAGVPIRNIGYLLRLQPRGVMMSCNKFRLIVEEVKERGFNPSKFNFVFAVWTLKSMAKSTWDRKSEAYKKWGWSENDIDAAFRKCPSCMAISEDKITSVMEFLVNKMGWKPSSLANRPALITLSLEKRIIPRCEVYQALVSKGLVKPGGISLSTLLGIPENRFLKRFIDGYEEEASELLKLYKEKLNLAEDS